MSQRILDQNTSTLSHEKFEFHTKPFCIERIACGRVEETLAGKVKLKLVTVVDHKKSPGMTKDDNSIGKKKI